ncbi:hypothetical protein [Halomonas sp.]|uniref:hypothetical protein n=1 Tax=Halomonas sp. TaxID=1486246 RepID=UPI003A90A72B
MIKTILLAGAMATAFLSQSVNAYDPDGFHRCILENMREGMGNAAVMAVRQSCAHLNETTSQGEKLPPLIAPDSYINELKLNFSAEFRSAPECRHTTIDSCAVMTIRDALYPSRSFEEVREWLYRSQSEHGPIPPREN